jgi:raffinose/stachyose/melibiose transport system substrate-binding protein
MKKARFMSTLLAAILLFTLVLSGCGSQQPAENTPSKSTEATGNSTAPAEKVKLTVLTRWTGSDAMTPLFDEIIKGFTELHPEVEIQNDSVNEEAAFNNKLKTAIATGDVPNVFYNPGIMNAVDYAKNGIVMEISPLFEDKEWYDGFIDGAFETYNFTTFGAKGYYAIPHSIGVEGIFYNKDLFAKAGITKAPETIEDMYDAIDKLKAIGVSPFAVGAKETWRAGHILNWLTYKNVGIDKVKQIGARNAKWTDPDMVDTLKLYMDLKNRGAFPVNYEGVTYDEEKSMFFTEKAAMVLNGSWFIGDCDSSDISGKIGIFAPPSFKDKPQFIGNGIIYPQQLYLSGKATGAQKDMQIAFVKYLTNKDNQQKMALEIQRIPIRKDLDLSSAKPDSLFSQAVKISSSITLSCGDTFDFDPLPSMMDRTRNSLIGMSLGMSPEDTAKEIQSEIDKNQ